VANFIEREFLKPVTVVTWGVDLASFPRQTEHQGYVLWNKNRADAVCNPAWVNALAERLPGVQFVTTFGQAARNVKVIGPQSHEDMKRWLAGAAVYLATTKETGDIGSKEAMASGIPVVGLKHGAMPDFLGLGGLLGVDLDSLTEALNMVMNNRQIFSDAAYQQSRAFDWQDTIQPLQALIERAHAENTPPRPLITVVIPCHNYSHFLPDALNSLLAQDLPSRPEIIVVNDASTDNANWAALERAFPSVLFLHLENNAGVAEARNIGARLARGKYLCFLDADDRLEPAALRSMVAGLQSDPMLGIAYTALQVNSNGTRNAWPPLGEANAPAMLADTGRNDIPTCNVMSKALFERSGGYRARYRYTEDSDLWRRLLATGIKGRMVSEAPLFNYRTHQANNSRTAVLSDEPLPLWRRNLPFPVRGPGPSANPVHSYDRPALMVCLIGQGEWDHQDWLNSIDSLGHLPFYQWGLCYYLRGSKQRPAEPVYPLWAKEIKAITELNSLAPYVYLLPIGQSIDLSQIDVMLSGKAPKFDPKAPKGGKIMSVCCGGKAAPAPSPFGDADFVLIEYHPYGDIVSHSPHIVASRYARQNNQRLPNGAYDYGRHVPGDRFLVLRQDAIADNIQFRIIASEGVLEWIVTPPLS
jgi:glycosyltransferase involved in cell wall biosynthesis